MRKLLFLFLLIFFAVPSGSVSSEETYSADFSIKKNYGYFIGDFVEVSYELVFPSDKPLNRVFLPKKGETINGWLEVKKRKIEEGVRAGRRICKISYVYQIFAAPEEMLTKIPGIRLSDRLVLPEIPIIVSPLTFKGARFMPPAVWQWENSLAGLIAKAGIVVFAAGLVLVIVFTRRRFRSRSVFGPALKKLSSRKEAAFALFLFRNALNTKAGKAVFPDNLEELFLAFPKARKLQKEISEMIGLSDEASFDPKAEDRADIAVRVSALLKQLKKEERWR